jgi:ABC-2 type transport system ATP-binding protein
MSCGTDHEGDLPMISNDGAAALRSPASGPRRPILSAEHLQKRYGDRRALWSLSFSLDEGRVLGFLGPNGAGKTTAIRILTTILEPDAGYFVVDGISSQCPERVRYRIGVLPESQGFPKEITAIAYLTFFGQHYGLTTTEAKRSSLALLEQVGLQKRAKSLVGGFSRGMRQRLGIARALVHDPAVVFLDEPTLGLDPRGQQELLALVRRIAEQRGVAIVLCSHLLSEIESVCDDVIILSGGQVVAQGTVDEVVGRFQGNAIRIHVPTASVAEARQRLAAVPHIATVLVRGDRPGWLRVKLDDGATTTAPDDDHFAAEVRTEILETLIRARIPILTFEVGGDRLQDVFLRLTEDVIR